MATGRGAWNARGAGGTKQYKDQHKPGPYYFLGSGYLNPGRSVRTPDEYAVHKAVLAYQRAAARRLKRTIEFDGLFGPQTYETILAFQKLHPEVGIWGGVGPDTSKALLYPDLWRVVRIQTAGINSKITPALVSGTIRHESLWDAGAVGYLDPTDLGLAQINGRAHPDMPTHVRLDPLAAFKFIVDYYNVSLRIFKNNLRDAVAAYNLGGAGARAWIAAGRPTWWQPRGSTSPRNMQDYIDSILAG